MSHPPAFLAFPESHIFRMLAGIEAFIYTLEHVQYKLPEDVEYLMDDVERVEACFVDHVARQDGQDRDQHAISFIKRMKT